MATRKRTRARELALQFLYQDDVNRREPPAVASGAPLPLDDFLRMQTSDDLVHAFAESLVVDVLREKERIDAELTRVAQRWDVKRMAPVDRNILRIGVAELLLRDDIPPQVTLNEAIELAKRFSTAKSGKFVNGVLDRIRADLGRPPTAASGVPARRAAEPQGDTDEELPDLPDLIDGPDAVDRAGGA